MKYSRLFIVCGHGMGDNGLVDNGATGNGTNEYTEAKEVAQELHAEIRQRYPNVEVYLLGVDKRQTLLGKIRDVNGIMKNHGLTANDCLLVDIHLNSAVPEASGVETWYAEEEGTKELADLCTKYVALHTKLPKRASKEAKTNRHGRLGILNDTKAKGVLVECGFVTSKFDSDVLKDNKLDDGFARGIADALGEFAGWSEEEDGEVNEEQIRRAMDKNSQAWQAMAESKRQSEIAQNLLHEANEILRGNL